MLKNAPSIQLKFFIRGELGNEDDQLKALRRNRVQISGVSLQGLATVIPELNVAMAPYLFTSVEEVDFIYDNFLDEPISRLLADKGMVFFAMDRSGVDGSLRQQIGTPSQRRGQS